MPVEIELPIGWVPVYTTTPPVTFPRTAWILPSGGSAGMPIGLLLALTYSNQAGTLYYESSDLTITSKAIATI